MPTSPSPSDDPEQPDPTGAPGPSDQRLSTPPDWEAFYAGYKKPDYIPGLDLKEKLGAGMFGMVFRATRRSVGRDYAVKFLKIDDSEVRRAVLSELDSVRWFAQVDHPNLVAIEDMGTVDGIPYIVMGFGGSETLKDRLDALVEAGAETQGQREELVRLVLQAARGLSALHDRSLVHFDLKPANVFVKGGVARLGDYGLSRLMAGSRNTLSMGRGTPYYMAPEVMQQRGDVRSDVYSLGVMLYEVVIGELPFSGSSEWEVLRKHEVEPPEFPHDLPPAYRSVLARCLAKKPDDRFQTVAEMLQALGVPGTAAEAALSDVEQGVESPAAWGAVAPDPGGEEVSTAPPPGAPGAAIPTPPPVPRFARRNKGERPLKNPNRPRERRGRGVSTWLKFALAVPITLALVLVPMLLLVQDRMDSRDWPEQSGQMTIADAASPPSNRFDQPAHQALEQYRKKSLLLISPQWGSEGAVGSWESTSGNAAARGFTLRGSEGRTASVPRRLVQSTEDLEDTIADVRKTLGGLSRVPEVTRAERRDIERVTRYLPKRDRNAANQKVLVRLLHRNNALKDEEASHIVSLLDRDEAYAFTVLGISRLLDQNLANSREARFAHNVSKLLAEVTRSPGLDLALPKSKDRITPEEERLNESIRWVWTRQLLDRWSSREAFFRDLGEMEWLGGR